MKVGVLKTYDPNMAVEAGSEAPYVMSETLDLDKYDDITSMLTLVQYGGDFDNKKLLVVLNEYLTETGFDNMSEDEKILACRYFLVPVETILLYLTMDEMKAAWETQNNLNKKARQDRWDAMFNLLSFSLPKQYGFDLAFTVDQLGLSGNYLTYGLESYDIDGIPGLWDYMEGTSTFAGSPGTGFPSKPYWTSELQTAIMDILREGNY